MHENPRLQNKTGCDIKEKKPKHMVMKCQWGVSKKLKWGLCGR